LKNLLFFLILLKATQIFAQKPSNDLGEIREETIFPKRTVRCLLQDSEGYLWIGTSSGLYLYDGLRLVNYVTNPTDTSSIGNNTINSLSEDKKGNIWVGTESFLSVFDKKSQKFKNYLQTTQNYTSLTNNSENTLWGMSSILGLFKIDNSQKISPFSPKISIRGANQTLKAINPTTFLFGTTDGLFIINTETKSLNKLKSDKNISAVFIQNPKNIWVGTRQGQLTRFELKGNILLQKSNYNISRKAIVALTANNSYVLAATNTQLFYAELNKSVSSFSLFKSNAFQSENNILQISINPQNNIWIGTERGLFRVQPSFLNAMRFRISTPTYLPINNHITNLMADSRKNLWIATNNDGVFKFDPHTKQSTRMPINGTIRYSAEGQDKNLYFGADTNLLKMQPKGSLSKVYNAQENIACFVEVNKDEWWGGCWRKGIFRYSLKNETSPLFEKLKSYFTGVSPVFSILKDRNENVWFGIRGEGIVKVNLKNHKIKKYQVTNGLASNRILSINEDHNGNIWVATRDAGLLKYLSQKDSFQQFTTHHGLPSNAICGLAEDSHSNLFVSTENGIAKFLPNSILPFQTYNQDDGIINPEFSFNAAAQIGDKIYFGNRAGLYEIQNKIGLNTSKSALIWSDFEVFDSDNFINPIKKSLISAVKGGENVVLNANENNITISFTTLDFAALPKIKYAYRLVGKETDWKTTDYSNRRIQYLDLTDGKYTFEVKFSDSNGRWNNSIKKLDFTINPPFWKSNWAYLVYLFILLVGIYLLWRAFKNYKDLQKKLEEKNKYQSLQNQQMIFFSDLSHEIKNRLSLILGPLEDALAGKKVNQAILVNLYEQAQRLKRLTDQIMNIRRTEAGEFLLKVSESQPSEFIKKLCKEAEPWATLRNIQLVFEENDESEKGWFDDELLEIMVLNLLNNAIKYTQATGEILVKTEIIILEKSDLIEPLHHTGKYLCCKIYDSGIGIPEQDIKQLFNRFYRASNTRNNRDQMSGTGLGLDLVARLIKLHKGFIDIKSEVNKFTEVIFYIPIEKEHFNLNEIKLSTDNITLFEVIEEEENKKHTTFTRSNQRVLLVDDDENMLQFLGNYIERQFEVLKANNGKKALEILKNNQIDIIISDWMMPIFDGFSLLKAIRLNKELNHIPFIMLTAQNSESQKIICLQNGVNDYIEKPFSIEMLAWRIRNILYAQQHAQPSKIQLNPMFNLEKSPDEEFIQKIIEYIEQDIEKEELGVEYLAERMGMSRATFYRKMESLLGEAPSVFIKKYRMKKAAQLLLKRGFYVADVAFKVGFSNPKYFTKCFSKEFGCTPAEYMKLNSSNQKIQ
jgi:signal transduction histidine kinase/ligand-binding sensor domain-containing protein/DNA-binding response OmpR family regulator